VPLIIELHIELIDEFFQTIKSGRKRRLQLVTA